VGFKCCATWKFGTYVYAENLKFMSERHKTFLYKFGQKRAERERGLNFAGKWRQKFGKDKTKQLAERWFS